jgi:hypothetical protein
MESFSTASAAAWERRNCSVAVRGGSVTRTEVEQPVLGIVVSRTTTMMLNRRAL